MGIKGVINIHSKNECGKSDRCRYDFDCPYLHYPLANYLCFDNKRYGYEDMKQCSRFNAQKRKIKKKVIK